MIQSIQRSDSVQIEQLRSQIYVSADHVSDSDTSTARFVTDLFTKLPHRFQLLKPCSLLVSTAYENGQRFSVIEGAYMQLHDEWWYLGLFRRS